MFRNGRVVSFSSMEQGVLSTGFGDKMVGAPDSSGAYVLGDESWVNAVGYKALHNDIDIPVFASVAPPEMA